MNTSQLDEARQFLARFAFQLQTPESRQDNFVISPFSIQMVLAQLLAGAKGETLKEMARVILDKTDLTPNSLPTLQTVARTLECLRPSQSTELRLANRLYKQKGKPLVSAFVSSLSEYFNQTVGEIDFAQGGGEADINQWVAKETAGKITQLFEKGQLTKATKLVLANALYVKGAWKTPFEISQTKPEPFFIRPQTKITVPTMHVEGEIDSFKYADEPDWETIVMPLADRVASLWIVLPREKTDLKTVLKKFDAAVFESTRAKLKKRIVVLSLPKFKVEAATQPIPALKQMGIKRAFLTTAQFEGIDEGKDNLYVSLIQHKAMIDVNEKGLEGAAATAASVEAGGMPEEPPRVEVKVNRPFLFLVVARGSGAILFKGWVTHPKT